MPEGEKPKKVQYGKKKKPQQKQQQQQPPPQPVETEEVQTNGVSAEAPKVITSKQLVRSRRQIW